MPTPAKEPQPDLLTSQDDPAKGKTTDVEVQDELAASKDGEGSDSDDDDMPGLEDVESRCNRFIFELRTTTVLSAPDTTARSAMSTSTSLSNYGLRLADLQKGERYANHDYAFALTLGSANTRLPLLISYDISCVLRRRVDQGDDGASLNYTVLNYTVPKFHSAAHTLTCPWALRQARARDLEPVRAKL
ncbi:hypothetical protein DFH06DRAFT_1348794 [Mycena polygramma]|nr:hypothetical protein DFH06DRAFT_1348794 [Mycena polygramma]